MELFSDGLGFSSLAPGEGNSRNKKDEFDDDQKKKRKDFFLFHFLFKVYAGLLS
jgi:hypothetical protein